MVDLCVITSVTAADQLFIRTGRCNSLGSLGSAARYVTGTVTREEKRAKGEMQPSKFSEQPKFIKVDYPHTVCMDILHSTGYKEAAKMKRPPS